MIEIETWHELTNINDDAKQFLLKNIYVNTVLWNELVRHFKSYLASTEKVTFNYEAMLSLIYYVQENYAVHEDVSLEILKGTVERFYNTVSYLFTSNTVQSKTPIEFKDMVSIYAPVYISKGLFTVNDIDGILHIEDTAIWLPGDMRMPREYTGIKLHYKVNEENNTEHFSITFI